MQTCSKGVLVGSWTVWKGSSSDSASTRTLMPGRRRSRACCGLAPGRPRQGGLERRDWPDLSAMALEIIQDCPREIALDFVAFQRLQPGVQVASSSYILDPPLDDVVIALGTTPDHGQRAHDDAMTQ